MDKISLDIFRILLKFINFQVVKMYGYNGTFCEDTKNNIETVVTKHFHN